MPHLNRLELLPSESEKWRAYVALAEAPAWPDHQPKFRLGDRVSKSRGSHWTGKVVGTYSTALTPEGYCVESETETGSVQLYPAAALEARP